MARIKKTKLNIFGNNIEHLRNERKLTLKELSSATGVPKSTIWDIELKGGTADLVNVVKFSIFFKVSERALITEVLSETKS